MENFGNTPENIYKDWFYKEIGNRITIIRKENGMTQQVLADYLSISRVSVVNIETGKQRMPLYALVRLCECLKCSITDIIPDDKEKKLPAVKDVEQLIKKRKIESLQAKIDKLRSG